MQASNVTFEYDFSQYFILTNLNQYTCTAQHKTKYTARRFPLKFPQNTRIDNLANLPPLSIIWSSKSVNRPRGVSRTFESPSIKRRTCQLILVRSRQRGQKAL